MGDGTTLPHVTLTLAPVGREHGTINDDQIDPSLLQKAGPVDQTPTICIDTATMDVLVERGHPPIPPINGPQEGPPRYRVTVATMKMVYGAGATLQELDMGPSLSPVLLGLNRSWPIPLQAQPVTSKTAQKSVPSKPAPSQSAPSQSAPLQSTPLQSAPSQSAPLQLAPHGKTRSGVIPVGSSLPHKVQASGPAERVLRLNKKNTLTNADAHAQEEANRLLGKRQGSRTQRGGCK